MKKALSCLKTSFGKDKNQPLFNPGGSSSAAEKEKMENLSFMHGHLCIKIIEAKDVDGTNTGLLKKMERRLTSSLDGIDPYCTVKLAYNSYMRSNVVENTNCPVWNAEGSMFVAHEADAVEIRVKAAKRKGLLGIVSKVTHLSMLSISAAEIIEKKHISGWFPLAWYRKEVTAENPFDDATSEPSDDEEETRALEIVEGELGSIHIDITYTPIEECVQLEVAKQIGLTNAYYPVRHGVNVDMYQDADVPPGMLPEIPFMPEYQHKRCWIDVSNAIMNATELIYITGWAVWPELKMVRTTHEGDMYQDITLGEMLKKKAEEGVTVCVMVWDEVASNMLYAGLMGTHDEEVVKYFKGSKVTAIKCSRQDQKRGPFADLNDSLMFTHHQKTIICGRYDEEKGTNRLQAFVGGLDLTDGRYDNPQHSLFRTLQGVHAPPDFWQACAVGISSDAGPREPWHDIHSHLTGAIAWDVLDNFESRWRKQGGRKQDDLYSGAELIMSATEETEIADGAWNVQLLRSINESSADIELDRPGLMMIRGHVVDSSIHDAYIHAIRRAKNHIFLENQYFLGSSHVWDKNSKQRGGFSNHLVAIEIAEKICAKIRAGQRFVVYLIVPMYPEGPPDSGAVQEILAHQRKTVNLISTRVKKCIDETGSDTTVEDWFAMFCLVTREGDEGGQGNGGTTEREQELSRSRRFMIYVHSKFAIFDDETAIIGSANINSRSMDGARDTEIAAFMWQPEHVAQGPTAYGDDTEGEIATPCGEVAAFRCAVWSEHLGEYHEEFAQPSSLEAVRKIRQLATENWNHFVAETDRPGDMPHGHLAAYPYKFNDVTGEVLESTETFPDFSAALISGTSSAIPNMLTG